MDLGLTGKTALVVGGGRGIGRATVRLLAQEGAHVAVFSRTATEVEAAALEVRASGRKAFAASVDVLDRPKFHAAFDAARDALGAPSVLVWCVAPFWKPTRLQHLPDEELDQLLATDLSAALVACRRALDGMLEAQFGRLVLVGSLVSQVGIAGGTAYAAAKAGLEGAVRALSVDYARRGITANVVSPGFTASERLEQRLAGDPEQREKLVRHTTRRALVTPAEVAEAIVFLCSTRAAAITGTVLEVTAGAHLNTLW